MKVIDKIMSIIETYVSQLKEMKSIIDENAAEFCAAVIFNSAMTGFKKHRLQKITNLKMNLLKTIN
jgi:DNA-binding ferritin-like protein (Dps family)